MSKLSHDNYRNWSVDEVSTWLGEIHLSNHIPSFERNGITGARLAELSDRELRDQLRVVKPSELMALKGAISTLMLSSRDQSHKQYTEPPLSQRGAPSASRKVSGQSRTMTSVIRDRSGSGESPKDLPKTYTLPSLPSQRMPKGVIERPVILTPDLRTGSAPELLDDKCRYSGWIRKQGGGHKNWKRRYLILRAGCLYYFSNETASTPKGKFVLTGYEVSICRESDILKKYPFVLKISPMNPQARTYYVSFGSKGELERWKRELDEEIIHYNEGQIERVVMPLGSPVSQEEEEDDFEEPPNRDNIYDRVDGAEHDYEKPDNNIYDDPADINGEDGVYDRVEEIDPGDGRPAIAPRSRVSLQPEPTSKRLQPEPLPADADNDIYLPIISEGTVIPPPVSERVNSSPAHTPSTAAQGLDDDYVDPSDEEPDGSDSDDDGGYYIMFRKPDELMPQSCIFDQLERADADRLLRELSVDGTYLIREGKRAGAEKVLSVWHIDRCRHYKLFKDDESYFSLTQGQRFRSLPELLQYYSLQSHLPRSDFYLGNPYNNPRNL